MSDREKKLEQQVAQLFRLLFRATEALNSTTAIMTLELTESLGVDLKKEEPELWESLRRMR